MADSASETNEIREEPWEMDPGASPHKDWMAMNRREFMAAMGVAYGSAAYAWAAPRERFINYAGGENQPSIERFVNTLCPMCPGGCGLKVRVVHGCAVGVRGNTSHPINHGGLCSRASAILQDVYNPDRLHHPLMRVGPRGSGEWKQITWDEAIAAISIPLKQMREMHNPQGLCVVMGRDRGVARTAWERFLKAYGSPNLIDAHPADNLGALPAVLATHGIQQRLGYDLAQAVFVFSFASGWLDAHWSAEQAARSFADFRRGRPGFRPRWIHAEPRFSLTATKADEWLAIRPGTEGTLALGMAYVIIREGLYDREFVEHHCFGFEDWSATDNEDKANKQKESHVGFRKMVLADYPPAKVKAITGVSEGDLFRLGREFGKNRPAVALGFDGGGCATQATYSRMAIHCLNALVGSIDVPGGVTVFRELSLLTDPLSGKQNAGPPVKVDSIAKQGLSRAGLAAAAEQDRLTGQSIDQLADSIFSGQPYPTQALVLVEADPVYSLADGSRFGSALSKVPFVAAISGYHTDSSRYADVILPSLHGLHRWDYNTAHTLKGHPVVTLSLPVLPPAEGMKDSYEMLHAIAQQMGGSVAAALPWADGKEMVDAACRALYQARRGAAFSMANEENWIELLESRGWRPPFAEDYETFKRDLLAGGGWIDPVSHHREWNRIFQSPARKFAFASTFLASRLKSDATTGSGEPSADRRVLPDCSFEDRKNDSAWPLDLYVYTLPNLVSVASANLPWLNDIAGAYMFEKWRTWVEVHPKTAEQYGIAEGDQVVVQTPRGKLTLPAKIYKGIKPGVVAIPFGFGRESGGRWCENIGANPSKLVDVHRDPLTGTALWNFTQASIKKV